MRTIRHEMTLFFYDGVQVFEARDSIGGHYLAVMVEPDGEQDRYLVVGVPPDTLRAFRSGMIDLRSLILRFGEPEWYLVHVVSGLDSSLPLVVQTSPISDSGLLPEEGFVLAGAPATIEFLAPRFVGPRFSDHRMPLDVLKDLSNFQEMVSAASRLLYLKDHPGRTRVPRGFFEGVSIVLHEITEGSAITKLDMLLPSPPEPGAAPTETQVYFERARDSIIAAIDAVEYDEPILDLPESILADFARFGSSLQDGEHVEFRPQNPDRPARLNKVTRRRLILASPEIQDYAEELELVGRVAESSHLKETFVLELRDGSTVFGPQDRTHSERICSAHLEYAQGRKVTVKGVGRFNRAGKLMRIETVESVNLLELLDIGERIEDLRQLQAGWHDGHGIALNTEGLKWLEEAFLRYFDDVRLPLPRLFPTVEGRVQAEWSLGEWEVTLEIDLATRKGEFQAVQRLSDEPEEKVLELDEARAWQQLDAMLQRFCPEARA